MYSPRSRRRRRSAPHITSEITDRLSKDGLVAYPEDLGVDPTLADRSLLAARSISDLVSWSDGLYDPPARFRNW
jgi:malonate decarboxylase alpha subunit